MSNISFTLFDSNDYAHSERFSAWKESIGVIFDVRQDTLRNSQDFYVRLESYLIDTIVLNRCRSSCQKFDRKPIKIAKDGIDHYMLQVLLDGNIEMQFGSRQIIVPSTHIAAFDLAETLDSVNTDFDLLNVFIPRHILAPLLKYPDNVSGLVVDTQKGEGKLFSDFVNNIYLIAPTLLRI